MLSSSIISIDDENAGVCLCYFQEEAERSFLHVDCESTARRAGVRSGVLTAELWLQCRRGRRAAVPMLMDDSFEGVHYHWASSLLGGSCHALDPGVWCVCSVKWLSVRGAISRADMLRWSWSCRFNVEWLISKLAWLRSRIGNVEWARPMGHSPLQQIPSI